MSASPQAIQQKSHQDAQQQQVMAVYLTTMRQRFKAEINRLTNGGMQQMLQQFDDASELSFPLTYLYAWYWMRHNVAQDYREQMLSVFTNPGRLFLMRLLLEAESAAAFISGYIEYWQQQPPGTLKQQAELTRLLQQQRNQKQRLVEHMLTVWDTLGLFRQTYKEAFASLANHEKDRYHDMLGEADQQRLALVDALPEPAITTNQSFSKLGIIPVMGCPQTCRHCMFIWRPMKPSDPQPDTIYSVVNSLTDNVLFTGGDLTRHMDAFYNGIRAMRQVTTFAILLNGDFANDPETTEQVFQNMATAIDGRPAHWPKARVLLQISFDEFHQEVIVDKQGQLKERIPVSKIANIVECAPRYAQQVQLALLHKQTSLNFSMDVLQKGVFARLVKELGSRGHQLQILSTAPSTRLKRNPQTGEQGQVLKDASFVLVDYPDAPILLTSTTVDGYGRAATMEEGETVKERDFLVEVLQNGPQSGESFDIDLMFWFNGWATLFNAVHMCLGDVYKDGLQVILKRQRTDPLSHALHRFDGRLLELYAEVKTDLQSLLENATGPHHLFHTLTEDADVRLHMTRRLIEIEVDA